MRGAVALRGVRFGYGGAPVLDGFTLAAQPGQVVAIVGPTGAGKTTVINLLMRFYDADSGSITVDGQEILSLTRASLRRAYSMVLQDTWLFSGTVYENLAYGKEGVTLEQVRAAARAAKIDRFIEALPQGYDTVLRDGGNSISKGPAPAAHHRTGHAAGRADAHSGRSDLQCGHPHRTPYPGRHASADGRTHLLCHRTPAVHHPKRGRHRRAA